MSYDETILIRTSTAGDAVGLTRLAALDSADVPHGRALIAEVDGAIRAALPLDGGAPIADPFAESAHVLELLEAHARAFPHSADSGRSRGSAIRGRVVHAAASG